MENYTIVWKHEVYLQNILSVKKQVAKHRGICLYLYWGGVGRYKR